MRVSSPFTAVGRFQNVWRLRALLGEGNFGCVYEIKHRKSERAGAVKILAVSEESMRQVAQEEALIWRCIGQHRNIVKLHEVYEDNGLMFFVMEKCKCTVLSHLHSGFAMKNLPVLYHQMLSGIAHLHHVNIAHRDIKPENFLCATNSFDCVKLCDFGFAIEVPLGRSLKGVFGTPPYMSPEMLSGSYSLSTEIWSMGICCYYVHSGGRYPYEPRDKAAVTMKKAISEGSQIIDFEAPKNVSFEAKQFTIALLNRNPLGRPTAKEALRKQFISSSLCSDVSLTPSEQSTVASEQDRKAMSRASGLEDVSEESLGIEIAVNKVFTKEYASKISVDKPSTVTRIIVAL